MGWRLACVSILRFFRHAPTSIDRVIGSTNPDHSSLPVLVRGQGFYFRVFAGRYGVWAAWGDGRGDCFVCRFERVRGDFRFSIEETESVCCRSPRPSKNYESPKGVRLESSAAARGVLLFLCGSRRFRRRRGNGIINVEGVRKRGFVGDAFWWAGYRKPRLKFTVKIRKLVR